jgi:hypothetical protein
MQLANGRGRLNTALQQIIKRTAFRIGVLHIVPQEVTRSIPVSRQNAWTIDEGRDKTFLGQKECCEEQECTEQYCCVMH